MGRKYEELRAYRQEGEWVVEVWVNGVLKDSFSSAELNTALNMAHNWTIYKISLVSFSSSSSSASSFRQKEQGNVFDRDYLDSPIEKMGKSRRYERKKRNRIKKTLEKSGWQCEWCGCDDIDSFTIDHRVPRSRGGSNALDNLRILCFACNELKGNMLDHEVLERLEKLAELPELQVKIAEQLQY